MAHLHIVKQKLDVLMSQIITTYRSTYCNRIEDFCKQYYFEIYRQRIFVYVLAFRRAKTILAKKSKPRGLQNSKTTI